MDTDLPWMLEYIDSFLALPKLEQRKYQMARRMGFPLDWKQLWRMRESDQKIVEDLAKNIVDEKDWEKNSIPTWIIIFKEVPQWQEKQFLRQLSLQF